MSKHKAEQFINTGMAHRKGKHETECFVFACDEVVMFRVPLTTQGFPALMCRTHKQDAIKQGQTQEELVTVS